MQKTKCINSKSYLLNLNFPLPALDNIIVKANGTIIAITIATKNINIYSGLIDKIPGRPPTPIEFVKKFLI